MIKNTTAMRKISALWRRIWCIQGGQGAGKTFAILILIINFASSNKGKEIYIVSAELSKMRDTVVKDFVKILKLFGVYHLVSFTGELHGAPLCVFPNGSFVRFIGLDKDDIGKGLRSDLVFVNEANKIDFDTYRELTSRAKKIILDYNPNAKFWAHTEVLTEPDCDYLCLTFLDNEQLSEEERNTILSYKRKAYHNPDLPEYDFDANTKSKYWRNKWRIYGLGVTGLVDNRIYENWEPISSIEFKNLPYASYYGLDFGSSRPTALVEEKFDGNESFFTKQLLYKPSNAMSGTISQELTQIGVSKKIPIICDNADPLEIAGLIANGFNAIPAVKGPGSVEHGIRFINGKKNYYTDDSLDLENEYEQYEWEIVKGVNLDRPVKKNDHLLDAKRMVDTYLEIYLGIK